MTRLAVLSIALLGAACADFTNLGPDRTDVGWGGQETGNMDGFMRGDHANVRGFDDNTSQGWLERGPGYSYMELHVNGDYGWAMIGLNIDRDILDLAPGVQHTISYDLQPTEDGESVEGGAIGCSGPDTWDAEVDEPAQEATIIVVENPETGDLDVTVEADFGDNGTVTGGTTVEVGANRG